MEWKRNGLCEIGNDVRRTKSVIWERLCVIVRKTRREMLIVQMSVDSQVE